MAESALNQRMRKALRQFDPVRIENVVGLGTPDMNFTFGWIENKYLDHWPKNPELVVKLDHYTPDQRVWAVQRIFRGGFVWLMLQVGRDYLLFRGDVAARYLGLVTKAELLKQCAKCWYGNIDDDELISIIFSWVNKKTN
jgi:hypothetical protein